MSEKTSRGPMFGLFVLIGKIGGKLLKVVPKLFKALKLGKTGLAAGSFATYAVLFSWPFALVLMGSLFVHEMGHIWAMKRCGMKTKGVYFIPLLGAAAVTETDFPSRRSEVFIALMGPFWGFGLAILTFIVYLITDHALFAALAGWMAMINAFNLLPINPLDGGRVMKSTAYSISNRAGLWFMILGLGAAFALAWVFNLSLIIFLLFLGTIELLGEISAMRKQADRRLIVSALAEMLRCENDAKAVDARIGEIYKAIQDGRPEIDQTLAPAAAPSPKNDDLPSRMLMRALDRIGLRIDAPASDELLTRVRRQTCFSILLEATAMYAVPARRGLIRFWRKTADNEFLYAHEHLFLSDRNSGLAGVLRAPEAKPKMTPHETVAGFGGYLILAVALFSLMHAVAHIPAAKAALSVFIG